MILLIAVIDYSTQIYLEGSMKRTELFKIELDFGEGIATQSFFIKSTLDKRELEIRCKANILRHTYRDKMMLKVQNRFVYPKRAIINQCTEDRKTIPGGIQIIIGTKIMKELFHVR